MTKKHYIKIAQILKDYLNSLTQIELMSDAPFKLVDDFIDMLENDNPNFNALKFRGFIYKTRK